MRTSGLACGHPAEHGLLVVVPKVRLLAVGECRPDLHTRRALLEGLPQHAGAAIAAGEPERHAEPPHGLQVHPVALAVDRFAPLVQRELAARRGIVAAGGRPLDDEAVHRPVGLLQQRGREDVRRDDRQETGPLEGRQVAFHEVARAEVHRRVVAVLRARHVERIGGGLVLDIRVQYARDLERDARAHQDVANAREHRAVDRDEVRRLDLLEVVDPDRVGVAFAGEEDLHEVPEEAILGERARALQAVEGQPYIGRVRRLAASNVVARPDALGHVAERERVEGAAAVAARVTVLEPAGEHLLERGAGDDAEVAEAGDGLRQPPAGDGHTHPALDDSRGSVHAIPSSHGSCVVGPGSRSGCEWSPGLQTRGHRTGANGCLAACS